MVTTCNNCVWHLFHFSKHKAVVHLSSLSTRYSQADPGLGLHSTRAISGRQAEALQRRCLAGREAQLGANHPETLSSMDNLAVLLWKQGKLAEAGLMVFGVRGDVPGRFTKGISCLAKAWGLNFRFVSRYCWTVFWRTNAHFFIHVNESIGQDMDGPPSAELLLSVESDNPQIRAN